MDSRDAMKMLDHEPGKFSFGVYRNVLVSSWMSQATGPAVERLVLVAQRVASECPEGFSAVHLVPDGLPMPDAQARATFRQLLNDFSQQLACVAVVVGGDGFWASALRAVVTSIWQGTNHPFEKRIFGNAAAVVDWLPSRHEKRTGVALDTMTLRGLLAVARTIPSSRPPPERRAF